MRQSKTTRLPWPARDEELRRLWDERDGDGKPLSTRTLAERMRLTSNAVQGRAHRLKLEPRPSPIPSAPRRAVERDIPLAGMVTLPTLPSLLLPLPVIKFD